MKIIFFGTPQFVVPILEALTKQHEVVAVVTAPDQKVGRKQILTPSPVKVFAEKRAIPVLQPEKLKESASQLSALNPQLFVVAAYGKIIPKSILDIPHYGAINIHPSLLPKYRGPTPIQSAILNGDTESGIAIMLMDEQMDHGPLLKTIPYTITPEDTTENLLNDMFATSAKVLPATIEAYIQGTIEPESQDNSKATYATMFTKQSGYFDLQNPPDKVQFRNMVRAYHPWPNVWTIAHVNGKEVRIKFLPNNMIHMEGKQPVNLKDFLNGYPELREQIGKLY